MIFILLFFNIFLKENPNSYPAPQLGVDFKTLLAVTSIGCDACAAMSVII